MFAGNLYVHLVAPATPMRMTHFASIITMNTIAVLHMGGHRGPPLHITASVAEAATLQCSIFHADGRQARPYTLLRYSITPVL